MKNGNYILVIAPENFPGLKYRGRYCLEHHLVYWQHTGIVPDSTQLIHHINENRFDNRFENLRLMDKKEHSRMHSRRGRKWVDICCPTCGKIFSKPENETFLNKPRNQLTFCSRKCAVKFQHSKQEKNLEQIRKDSIVRKYKK